MNSLLARVRAKVASCVEKGVSKNLSSFVVNPSALPPHPRIYRLFRYQREVGKMLTYKLKKVRIIFSKIFIEEQYLYRIYFEPDHIQWLPNLARYR